MAAGRKWSVIQQSSDSGISAFPEGTRICVGFRGNEKTNKATMARKGFQSHSRLSSVLRNKKFFIQKAKI